jgi:4'-phosphopantetheinyl transferase
MTVDHGVDLWHISLDCSPDGASTALLDLHERGRVERLRFDRDRRRYVVAHAATRAILGRYLEVDPAQLRFSRAAKGKPAIVDSHRPIEFNLTHSGERAIVAVTTSRSVGVDLEQVRPDLLDARIARRFADPEAVRLAETDADDRAGRFTMLWTRKEALAKAFGGSIIHLLGLAVGDEASTDQGVLISESDALPGPHRVRDLRLADAGFRAAIALSGPETFVIRSHQFQGAVSC